MSGVLPSQSGTVFATQTEEISRLQRRTEKVKCVKVTEDCVLNNVFPPISKAAAAAADIAIF
jgi:hypothetical protein